MSDEGVGGQVRNELIRRNSTYESGCSEVSDAFLVLFYLGGGVGGGESVRHPEITLVEGNVLSLG